MTYPMPLTWRIWWQSNAVRSCIVVWIESTSHMVFFAAFRDVVKAGECQEEFSACGISVWFVQESNISRRKQAHTQDRSLWTVGTKGGFHWLLQWTDQGACSPSCHRAVQNSGGRTESSCLCVLQQPPCCCWGFPGKADLQLPTDMGEFVCFLAHLNLVLYSQTANWVNRSRKSSLMNYREIIDLILPKTWVICLQVVHAPYAMQWQVFPAPEPREVVWENLAKSLYERMVRETIIYIVVFFTVVFYMIPIAFISSLTTLNNLVKLVPFIKAIVDYPPLNTVLQVSSSRKWQMHFYISCTLLGLLALVECMYHFLLTPRQWCIILTEAYDAVAQRASSCCHPQRVFVGASST